MSVGGGAGGSIWVLFFYHYIHSTSHRHFTGLLTALGALGLRRKMLLGRPNAGTWPA